MLWLALVLTVIAAGYDLKSREVPDWISWTLFGIAVAARGLGVHPVSWCSLGGGLAVGFGLGALLFQLKVMGGGDVKLITALGAALGLPALLLTLFWTVLVGAVFGLVSLARGQHDLAYVPAIALGLMLYIASSLGW
jgi:prepilin peptidase CpaA